MAATAKEAAGKEGNNLLGPPTYKELENGRFKCVETGHELPAKDMESYGQSKRCRLGLINFALSQKKPPLNLFKQDPISRSKLICKLTGDTINKSEEHIWKHINGRRFLNKLEEKEAELNGTEVKKDEQEPQKESKQEKKNKKKKKKKQAKEVSEIISEVREPADDVSDSEEGDFWMPPVGNRWDFDDGGDRWGSGSESEEEIDEDVIGDDEVVNDSSELSTRTKRMSIEIGPDSFALKKKSKTDSTS